MKRALEDHIRYLDSTPPEKRNSSRPAPGQAFCGNCGQLIAIDDLFCAHCGARQPLPAAAMRLVAKLVVIDNSATPASFILDKDTNLIGRVDPHTGIFPEVDLSSYDPETKVSRRHARVYREGGQFLLEDLSSVNGTTVNGTFKLYPKQPRVLQNGDELKM